jgi:hypothetical protein
MNARIDAFKVSTLRDNTKIIVVTNGQRTVGKFVRLSTSLTHIKRPVVVTKTYWINFHKNLEIIDANHIFFLKRRLRKVKTLREYRLHEIFTLSTDISGRKPGG